jgi:hypothetical protein
MFRFETLRISIFAFMMLWNSTTYAIDYYVDQSCTNVGNGTADQCAGSSGGAGAFRDPTNCFSQARAGDTCYIKNGTYITTANNTSNGGYPAWELGGFRVMNSGTASAPITFRNYPGHSPILANCSLATNVYCGNPTISAKGQSYIVFDGLRVKGGFWIIGPNYPSTIGSGRAFGNVIRNTEIWMGWGVFDDGNWSPLLLESQTDFIVRNNFIHDIATPGGGQQSSGSCVKLYASNNTLIEFNTCRTVIIPESQAGGVDDKYFNHGTVMRYNWIEDVNVCLRIEHVTTATQAYGNVCISQQRGFAPRAGLRIGNDGNGDMVVYNNTFYGFGQGFMSTSPAPVPNIRMYNNIFSDLLDHNIENYSAISGLMNYNSWNISRIYSANSQNYSSLSAYSSATGFERNSQEADCRFVARGSDFHLRTDSPCIGFGRVGGTSSGSLIDLGAYGIASCVGHTCGVRAPSSMPTPTPAPVPSTTLNQAPVVYAGADKAVYYSDPCTLWLGGVVRDDGFPYNSLSVEWTLVSGPGPIFFRDRNVANAKVEFMRRGTYILRLTASDGAYTRYDDVTIVVK